MAGFSKDFAVPGKSKDEIYGAVSKGIEYFLSKTPLTGVEVTRDEASKKVSFKSNMASGTLAARDSALSVDISLSFLASAFKGKIEEGVTKWLNKTFSLS